MGMFDTLFCKSRLPDREVQDEEFQTKDFDCSLDEYMISETGELLKKEGDKFVKLPYHGDIRFYTSRGSHDEGNFIWYEYLARFTEGKLKWIKKIKK